MRYLHEEVVGGDCCRTADCDRKYNIDRIRRYKVTMHNTGANPRLFTNFVQFDKAKCTVPGCDGVYKQEGFNVGCQVQQVEQFGYRDAAWFSFPGTCPSQEFSAKTDKCMKDEPGGSCIKQKVAVPTGEPDCTYHMEEAGVILVDDLVGIGGGYKAWCEAGGIEFILHPETWKGKPATIDFWRERMNVDLNALRTRKLVKMFRDKYPDSPILPGTEDVVPGVAVV